MSVREALGLGVDVVASDVVDRPTGVVVVPVGDRAALCSTIGEVLDAPRQADEAHAPPPTVDSFADRLIELYRDQLASLAGSESRSHGASGRS